MTRINTNIMSMVAQQSLGNTLGQLQTSMTRLSTGLRINSGADDPSGLIASQQLQSNITSTTQAISNSQTAQEMIATADGALGQVSTLLNTIRGLVSQAASTGTQSSDQIAADQLQVDSALQAIDRISQTTQFQGTNLLDGSLDFQTSQAMNGQNPATDVQDITVNQAVATASNPMAVSVAISQAASQAQITGTLPTSSAASSAVAQLTFAGNKTAFVTDGTTGSAGNGIAVNIVESAAIASGSAQAQFTAGADGKGGTLNVYVTNVAHTTGTTGQTTLATIATAINNAIGGTTHQFTLSYGTGGAANVYTTGDTAVTGTTGDTANGGIAGTDTVNNLSSQWVVQIGGDKGSQVFNFQSGTSAASIVSAINLETAATGVSASQNNGALTLTSVDYGSSGTVSVKTVTDANGIDASLSAHSDAGTDVEGTINGYSATAAGNTLSIDTPTLAMSTTVTAGSSTGFTFNITGGGATFQLGPNVVTNQQAQLGIQAVNTGSLGGSAGWLYEIGSGQTASLSKDPATAANIVDEAITQVANLQGRMGAFQSTTVDSNIASLSSTLTNLTAANSNIEDTNFASETANLTRAQILEQSGYAVLSDANKDPQNVLKLLQ